MRPIILGCGNVGSSVARKLAELRSDLEFFIADINLDVAEALADEIGGGAKAVQVDVTQTKNMLRTVSRNVLFRLVLFYYDCQMIMWVPFKTKFDLAYAA